MQNNKLEILVTAKDAASDVITGVGKSFGKLSDNAVTGSKAMLAATVAAGAAAVAFGKSSVDAYFGAAEASAKLSTNLLNVKGNTQANVAQLESLASQLQAVGVIEDDVIKAGMSQLATFNLQGSTIASLTPKITDMVAQMKGHNATAEDMVGINNLVGKVMTGNVGALSRYGVTLSESQTQLLQNGNEAQRAAVLNEVLAQNYGKVNEALRNTPQGMMTGLKNDFGDLQEGVGELLVTAARPLLAWFGQFMEKVNAAGGFLDYFKGLIENNKDTVIGMAGALTAVLIPSLVGAAAAAAPIIIAVGLMAAAGYLLAPIINDLVNKFGGWDAVLATVKDAFNTLVGVVQGALGVLGNVASWFADNKVAIAVLAGGIIGGLVPAIAAWAVAQWAAVSALAATAVAGAAAMIPLLPFIAIGAVIAGLAFLIITNWDTLKQWFATAFAAISEWLGQFVSNVKQWFANAVNFVVGVWQGFYNIVMGIFGLIGAGIRMYINTYIAIIQGIINAIIWIFTNALNGVRAVWSGITGFFSGIVGGIRNALSSVTGAITAPFEAAFNFVKDLPGRIVGAIGNVGGMLRDKLGDFDIPGPLGKVRDVIPGFATGGFTGRGPASAVAGIVHKGEYVVPKHQVDQSTGLPYEAEGHVTNNLTGTFNFYTAEAVNAFADRLARDSELAAMGVPT